MLGLMIDDQEQKELEYVLKRELEEILFDLEEPRINEAIKNRMRKRYKRLFRLFQKVASEAEYVKYIPQQIEDL